MDICRLERVFDRTIGQLAHLPLKESVQTGILADIADWCGTIDVAEGFCRWVKEEYDEWDGPGWFRSKWEQYRANFLPETLVSKDNPNREWKSPPPPPPPGCAVCQDRGYTDAPDQNGKIEFLRCQCPLGTDVTDDFLRLLRETSQPARPIRKQERAVSSRPPFARLADVGLEALRRSDERRDRSERPERTKPLEEEALEELRRQEMEALRARQQRQLQESAVRLQVQ